MVPPTLDRSKDMDMDIVTAALHVSIFWRSMCQPAQEH